MSTAELTKCYEDTIWVCRTLFTLGKVTGSSANISFRYGDTIYISGSGTCFGTITKEQFAQVSLSGDVLAGPRPSKELPIHLAFYRKDPKIQAVVHTHGPYAELVSCLEPEDENNVIPAYTPYLGMKLGRVALVPYAPPGSQELFALVDERIGCGDALLLANHGAVVPGKSVMEAFYNIEELEDSARVYYFLRNVPGAKRIG